MSLREDIASLFWWVKPAYEVFDLFKAIIALVLTAALFAWTMIDRLPWSVIAAVVFTTFVSTIYLLLLPALFRVLLTPASPGPPNLSMYKAVQEFELWQAGCLLAGRSPRFPTPSGEPADWTTALIAAVRDGRTQRIQKSRDDFSHVSGGVYLPHSRTAISRGELKKFADAHKLRPEFLN